MTTATEAIKQRITPAEMQARMQRFVDASSYLTNAMAKLHMHQMPTWVLNPETGEFKPIIDKEMSETEKKYQEIISVLHKRIVVDGD